MTREGAEEGVANHEKSAEIKLTIAVCPVAAPPETGAAAIGDRRQDSSRCPVAVMFNG